MQRLTGGPLVPSSMAAGNTVYDDASLAMTAPGSPSVNNYANVTKDVLPQPRLGTQIPVGSPGMQQHAAAAHPDDGGGSWTVAGRSGGGWKETS